MSISALVLSAEDSGEGMAAGASEGGTGGAGGVAGAKNFVGLAVLLLRGS